MSEQTGFIHPTYGLLPREIEGFDSLAELALNLRWSWNHATDELWWQLDPKLWEITHNPWVVLQTVSRDQIKRMLADPVFRKDLDGWVQTRRNVLTAPAWFQQTHAQSSLTCAAYFSMEFMLSEALPIYSGGLGNVAGDQLKAASDLGVPVVGVGLLYQQGYFRQEIDKDGEQQALFPYNDPGQLPIAPLRQPNGEWLRLEIALPGYSIWLRAWQVLVGRVKLYLLDSNDAANLPIHRGITSELYGGGPDLRLKQELLLGIGGWRLLRALGVQPEVCHLNEGHAAFAVLERAHKFMEDTGQPFEVALAVTRAGNLFTTSPQWLPALTASLRLSSSNTLGVCRKRARHCVSRSAGPGAPESARLVRAFQHGVSGHPRQWRGEWCKPFARGGQPTPLSAPVSALAGDEIPVGHVTNGVHMPTWDSAPADDLWMEACGKGRWLGTTEPLEQDIRRVSDARLWQFRIAATKSFVEYVRERLSLDMNTRGAPPEEVEAAKHLFDPSALTLGFARRFATYKRPNLLLHDPPRCFVS